MAQKKTKEQKAAEACGMNADEWTQARQQAARSRTRGRRPAGAASADAKLATWGAVDDQMQLFPGADKNGGAA